MLKCDPPQSPSLCRDQWKEGRKGEELRPPGYQQLGAGVGGGRVGVGRRVGMGGSC